MPDSTDQGTDENSAADPWWISQVPPEPFLPPRLRKHGAAIIVAIVALILGFLTYFLWMGITAQTM